MKTLLITIVLLVSNVVGCLAAQEGGGVVVGAERLPEYIHLLQGKRVGVLTSRTAIIEGTHIIDTLLKSGVEIKRIFAPQRGFDGGKNDRLNNSYFGIEIVTLNQPPKANDVFACDVVVCDIQGDGVRDCSEVLSLGWMMQVCADIAVPLVVLDYPNPMGRRVDGAILDSKYRTKGELPLPLMYGMTLGELALMTNGEGWLSGGVKCPLTVVPYIGNAYSDSEELSSLLFQVFVENLGVDLTVVVSGKDGIDLTRLIEAYRASAKPEEFIECCDGTLDSLMGVEYVDDMIELGYSSDEICSMWRADANRFEEQRKAYLIYEN